MACRGVKCEGQPGGDKSSHRSISSTGGVDAAEVRRRGVRTLDFLLLRGVRDQFRGPDALAAARAMDQAHTQDGHRAPGTTGALQLEGRPAMSTHTSSRATAPRASGAATSGPARPSSTSASARSTLPASSAIVSFGQFQPDPRVFVCASRSQPSAIRHQGKRPARGRALLGAGFQTAARSCRILVSVSP